jgi:hypothetical protein
MKRMLRISLTVAVVAGGLMVCSPSSEAGPWRRGPFRGWGYGPGWGYRGVYRPYGFGWGGVRPVYRAYGWGYPAYGLGYPGYGLGYTGYGINAPGLGIWGMGPGYGMGYNGFYGTSMSIGNSLGGFYMSSYPF